MVRTRVMVILHCSHHQLQLVLQHTNIKTHIIISGMEMLAYLSASSIQLTISTYDAFCELDLCMCSGIVFMRCISCVGEADDGVNGEAESDWRLMYAGRMAPIAASL